MSVFLGNPTCVHVLYLYEYMSIHRCILQDTDRYIYIYSIYNTYICIHTDTSQYSSVYIYEGMHL